MEIIKKLHREKRLTVGDVKEAIEDIAPPSLQEPWDNSGLLLSFECSSINKILICLEINHEVVREAVALGADMIITHHPVIFGGISSISDKNPSGRALMRLIQERISVYSCHTPFDKVRGGNNDWLAELLGLSAVKNLKGQDVLSASKMADNMDEADIGRIGRLRKPMNFMDFIAFAADKLSMSIRDFHIVGELENEIETIGICTGAGADMIPMAAEAGCRLMITGDVKYHEARHAADRGICVLDAGHYGTEKFFSDNMREKLEEQLGDDVEIICSAVNLDPFQTV